MIRAGVTLTPDMTPRDQAIAIVESSRVTHVEWAAYIEDHPGEGWDHVGDLEHHRGCIVNYDIVLDVLKSIPPEGDQ